MSTILDSCTMLGVRLLTTKSETKAEKLEQGKYAVQLQHGVFFYPQEGVEGVDFLVETETIVKGLNSDKKDVEVFSVSCKHRFAYSVLSGIKMEKIEKNIDEFRHPLFLVSRSHVARSMSEMGFNPQGLPYSLVQQPAEKKKKKK